MSTIIHRNPAQGVRLCRPSKLKASAALAQDAAPGRQDTDHGCYLQPLTVAPKVQRDHGELGHRSGVGTMERGAQLRRFATDPPGGR